MRPKATLKQHSNLPFYKLEIGGALQAQFLNEETARHMAAAWNACRDIPTDELEALALSKILVENEKS